MITMITMTNTGLLPPQTAERGATLENIGVDFEMH